MARIRTIKPEFWADEKLSLLDPTTRLVFLGLVSMADDAGRLVDNVKLLDGMLFPNTDDSCGGALDTLARLTRIVRYTSASGQQLIQIAQWGKHQKVDKPSKYNLPGPESAIAQAPVTQAVGEPSRESREGPATHSRSDHLPSTYDLRPPTSDRGPQQSADVALLLSGLPQNEGMRMAWAAEIAVAKTGLNGPVLTDEQIDRACRDYVGKGHLSDPSLRHFRGFLADTARPKAIRPLPLSPRPTKTEIGRANLAAWLATDETPNGQ